MLVVTKFGTDRRFVDTEFHVGNPGGSPGGLKFNDYDLSYIFAVQADGDELAAIYEQDLAELVLQKRVVRWFGDRAQFIVANLKL